MIRTFALQSAVFFQRIEFIVQCTWKDPCSHLKLAAILPYIILSKENVRKLAPVRFFLCAPFFERVLHDKLSGLRKHDFSRVFAFPSTLHDELNSLKEPSTFKG